MMRGFKIWMVLGGGLGLLLGMGGRADAGPVSIVNASFEADPTSFFTSLTPTGWNFLSGGGGVFRPASANNGGNGNFMDITQFPSGAPDGIQVAFVQGGSILSQVTSTAAVVGRSYTLDVWAGTQNNFGSSSPFSVGLYDGGTAIASFSGIGPYGSYQEVVITGVGRGLGNLEVRLTAVRQTLFDSARLTDNGVVPVPEPSTLALGFLGAAGTLGVVRRRRKAVSV